MMAIDNAASIRTIGVLGAGTMGTGIAQTAARAGFDVILCDLDRAIVERSVATMDQFLRKAVEKGKLAEADRAAALARVRGTADRADLAGADLVVEAIVERLDAKREAFRALDGLCRPEVILASNTSSISITEIAAATGRPDRVVGMHFFNPVPVMQLVEIVRGHYTSDATVAAVRGLAARLGKETVLCRKDSPGFIVNRILMPMLAEAMRLLEEGVATPEDVDKAVQLGLNHPMGPFTLADFIGLDVDYYVMDYLYSEFRDPRFAPPRVLKELIRAGRLGRKNGRGFYDYGHGPRMC